MSRKIDGLKCILLIDDDEDDNFISKRIIQRMLDVEVRTVANGREALEYLKHTGPYEGQSAAPHPDLILLDINMHKMNGWEFLEQYKTLPEYIRKNVVMRMLTTSFDPNDADRARKYDELSGFLQKPLTQNKLENIVAMHFDRGNGTSGGSQQGLVH